MIKTFKWIYRLGYNSARSELLTEIEKARDFHMQQSQIKSLQEDDDKYSVYKTRKVTHQEHDQRYQAMKDLLQRIDPNKYPDLDKFMDLLS